MRKDAQEFEECMKRLKKTIEQQRREHGDSEDARCAEVFMELLRKKANQSRQENEKAIENEKAMGSSDTGVYVDMALEHERKLKETRAKRRVSEGVYVDMALAHKRKLNENAHNAGARRARRADVSKRADAEASRARRAKTPMKAYKVGTNFGRKKPKMNRIIEL